MTAAKALDHATRLAGLLALVLGLALWGGWLGAPVGLHMTVGVAAVLGLWALAALALRRGAARGLAALALPWGLATLALGLAQAGLLMGDLHWVVEVAHLLLGLGAMALAAALAEALRRARAA